MTIQELLNTKIQDLGLNARTINALSNTQHTYNPATATFDKARIVTLLDLMNTRREDLLRFRNLGKKAVSDITYMIELLIEKHIDIFNQFSNQEFMALGLNAHALHNYIREKNVEFTPNAQTASATQSKIDIRKKEIAEYYASIENIKKLIAQKEFEIIELQKQSTKPSEKQK